ncbi:MAG: hypothetical protein RL701_274, partial [Pseudomonadota bacterium]
LTELSPAVVLPREETVLTVRGHGFLESARVALDSHAAARLKRMFRVRLGAEFETTDVERVDAQSLRFTLPGTFEQGSYDLSVETPQGTLLTLAGALLVRSEPSDEPPDSGKPDAQPDPDPNQDALTIETAPGGTGEVLVPSSDLTVGDSIVCYAVLRDDAGEFVQDASVSWTVSGAGSDSSSSGTQLTLRVRASGTLQVTARLGELSAQVSWAVVPAASMTRRAMQLAIEPATRTLHAGDSPLTFSVRGQDALGNATDDLGELTWRVADGDFGAFEAETATLTPVRVGAGHVAVRSSYDLAATSGTVTVLAGAATTLSLAELSSVSWHAGDSAVQLTATAHDAFGNVTTDTGALTWRTTGPLGSLDPETGLLTPLVAGIGSVVVESERGLSAETPILTIEPAAASQLTVSPETAELSADSSPLQFSVVAYDAYGNLTQDTGTLGWSVASGDLLGLSASGVLQPLVVSSGAVGVMSSYGVQAQSGTITILPGVATVLTISPQTWTGTVGDDAQVFTVEARDTHGNVVSDVGPVTYAIASGTISEIDAPSGVFSPRTAGDGTISVTTADGLSAQTQNVHIDPLVAPAVLSALRGPDSVWPGQRAARFELDVTNSGTRDIVVSGAALSFAYSGADNSSEYVVRPGLLPSDRVRPSTTRTLTYFVDAIGTANKAGTLNVTAAADLFLPSGYSYPLGAATTSVLRANALGVQVAITLPALADTRVCTNQAVNFTATTTRGLLPSYLWRFAQDVTSTSQTPSAQYLGIGFYPYEVTATDVLGLHDTALGLPVFVGVVGETDEATYPTGPIVFAAPSGGQSAALASLPRTDLLQLNDALRQCDGTAIAATGHNILTVYSDRGLIDPSADVDSARPGIQLALTASAVLANVPLRAPPSAIEGATTLYVEYADDNTSRVTAAGDTTFQLTQDTTAPFVLDSSPAQDCANDCLGPTDTWLFRFSEPMATASLAGVLVERLTGNDCSSSVAVNLTATATRLYDETARTLTVNPPTQPDDDYTLRVTLPATLTDRAAVPNVLVPFVRCARVKARAAASIPATPYVSTVVNATFSPDGDGSAETATWTVRVADQVAWLRLRIRRADKELWAQVLPVQRAGEYALSWSGVDAGERVVGNGVYRYDVFAFNRAGVASSARTGFVEVQHAVHLATVRSRY